jgi:D-alanyl-D-alanine endopeptidase (penicillin-binding protein 7)
VRRLFFVCRPGVVVTAALCLAVPGFAWALPQTSSASKTTPPKTTTTRSAQQATPAKPAAKPPQTRSSLARARAASAARARQAAASRQLRDAMTPVMTRDALGNPIPVVRAAAAIAFDPQTGNILWQSNSQEQRSIASLTKLMTAVVFVADDPDLDQKIAVTRADMKGASTTYIRAGEVISYRDLLHLTLIASDNAAARVLARTSEGGTDAFVGRMNQMAANLGLANTAYVDPSGLDSRNVSSAFDLSHLITFAADEPVLGPIMRTAEYQAHTSTRVITVHSTNKLLGTGIDVLGGKTGYISKAGYCLATLLKVPGGPQVAVVVLGANNSTVRFWDARHLFNWVSGRSRGLVGGDEQ